MQQVRKWAVGGASLVSLLGACGDDDRSSVDAGLPGADGSVVTDGGVRDGGALDSGALDAGGTDAGRTDAGASTGDRAALEQAIQDSCELFVSCYPDEYTLEDCISYYAPYVDVALGIPGCPAPLVSYFECLTATPCDAPEGACESELAAATAACPEIFEEPPP